MRALKTVLIPMALLGVAVVLVAVVMIAQWQLLERRRALVDHSQTVIAHASQVMQLTLAAESAQRGYILTGDPVYLTPYEEARRDMPQVIDDLRAEVADNPEEAARAGHLLALWTAKVEEMASTIARADDREAVIEMVQAGAGKAITNTMRTEADALIAARTFELDRQTGEVARSELWSRSTILAGLAAAAVGLIASLVVLGRANERLEREAAGQRGLAEDLARARDELSRRFGTTSLELAETLQRLEAALRGSPLVLTSQDRDLRYTFARNWIAGSRNDGDHGGESGPGSADDPEFRIVGLGDADILPESVAARVTAVKTQVLQSGEPKDVEVNFETGGVIRWLDLHVEPIRADDGSIAGVTSVGVDVTERRRREQHVRLLMRELAHRSKNTLAVVQAMARQTASSSGDKDDFVATFEQRLGALAAAHTLLANEGWTGARLHDLVRSQLGHLLDLVDRQIFISGPDLTLPIEMIQNIGLALHELSTNASKYGALSTPEGRVDVVWTVTQVPGRADRIEIAWTENGGPPVTPPTRKGFGRIVIERTVARAVGGEVALDYAPEGLRWRLSFDAPAEPDDAG
ncbi:sensor histidine kinase [Methylobrevis pamukkalensis]|uniref:Blue-light-activated histidine kinase n=1 Tax=Methylobrevis pamukkalensis TaxID=1439726 RepID=A0A1E3H6Z3_9HYPH|nr:CHASE3 domain-containing protein [Methylobrevis pamukkalensis]ODN72090.1 Blue-light-activated histidine kinase [Methylobrevis pamukkalensis]